jgi:hypothetical protein
MGKGLFIWGFSGWGVEGGYYKGYLAGRTHTRTFLKVFVEIRKEQLPKVTSCCLASVESSFRIEIEKRVKLNKKNRKEKKKCIKTASVRVFVSFLDKNRRKR